MFSFLGNLEHAAARMNSGAANITAIPQAHADPRLLNSISTSARSQYAKSDVMYSKTNFSTLTLAQAQTIYTQPSFYSPLHTPQNWQMPGKRREIYQWCRYWYGNEPKVAAAIDFYSTFPMNGFETQCDNSKIKLYFDTVNKKLNMDYWTKQISKENFLLGDVFPFCQLKCSHCGGNGINDRGEVCEHPGGTFNRVVILNPDWMDVQTSVLADEPVITMLPDDTIKRIVWYKQPKEHYDRIPPYVRQLIMAGRPIPLDSSSISHIKYNPYSYGDYGESMIKRLFKVLAYKDKLMTAQWIVAERLILPIRIVKVGDKDRPAGPVDIADMQSQLASVTKDPNLTLVTHHAVDYDWYGSNGKVLQLSNEYELINKEILQGLMINEALLSGEMGSYQGAAIGAESLVRRLENWRLELARWIEDKIYKRIAKMKVLGGDENFIDKEATKELEEYLGEPVYKYPKIKWNDMNIRDATQKMQIYMQLHDKQVISTDTLCKYFGFDYDHEVEQIRYETAAQQFAAGGAAGGMPPAGGAGMDPSMGMDAGAGAPPPPDAGIPGGTGPGGAPGQPTPMPDAGMGGGMPGAAPTAAASAGAGGSAGKVLSKGRASAKVPEEEAVQPAMIRLTSLEQAMYKTLLSMNIPFKKWIQFPLGKYKADFAIPAIKLAIECDGDYWHQQPQARAHDMMRDKELSAYGWQVIRYTEDALKENLPAVAADVQKNVNECWKRALQRQKASLEGLKASAKKSFEKDVTPNSVINGFFRVNQPFLMAEEKPSSGFEINDDVEFTNIEIISFSDRMKVKHGAFE